MGCVPPAAVGEPSGEADARAKLEHPTDRPATRGLTRRRVLAAAGTAVAGALGLTLERGASRGRGAAVAAAVAAERGPVFVTRPDLRIPTFAGEESRGVVAPGLIFVAPYNAPHDAQAGAVIASDDGALVWERPLVGRQSMNFRVQSYQGAAALTWWEGRIALGHGIGHYVIADSSYRTLATPNAGNGLQGDLHAFLLTDRGTALLTSYVVTPRDLRSVGGPRDGSVQDAIFQEVDLASGRVLLEWHSLDHIPLTESYWGQTRHWDYVHLNSIAVDLDGNLLVSSRNTHTVYKIDRRTGEIIWRLGGKRSDFTIARDAAFAWQHDAQRQPDGSLTLFDNGTTVSRALVLAVDEVGRRVALRRACVHPGRLFADSQGSVQILPNGNIFVGWGAQPYVSEFTPDATLVFDARLADGYISYRAYRLPWTGVAPGRPTVLARATGAGTAVHVSWNGDTRVTRWSVLGGRSAAGLRPLGSVSRTGFETAMRLPGAFTHVRVQGRDAAGRLLATSALARV